MFLRTIPYNLYALLTIFMVFYIIVRGIDFGLMKKHEINAENGDLFSGAKDEFDNGERQLLNFGHTMAHSIEKCSNFEIAHGSAVAIGMVIAAKASFTLGWSNEDCTQSIIDANKNNSLPVECGFSPADLADIALSDKKRSGGTINFVVPEVMGNCVLKKIPVELLYKIAECK